MHNNKENHWVRNKHVLYREGTLALLWQESLPQDFPDTPAWRPWRMFTDAALESQNWHDWSAMLGPSDARPRRHQCKTSTS